MAAVWLGMAIVASAGIPTFQERLTNSGLDPSGIAWRGENIRKLPLPGYVEGQPLPMICYRKDFTLPAKPRLAAITVMPSVAVNYSISVNGTVVAPVLPAAHNGFRNLDITAYLRAGPNVIGFRGQPIDRSGISLLMDGIVFCADGSTLRLLTDKTWKIGADPGEGWDKIGADIAGLAEVQSLGVERGKYFFFSPPYYGPIQIKLSGMSQPIFDAEKPVQMDVLLMNAAGSNAPVASSPAGQADAPPAPVTLEYEIFDEIGRQAATNGAVALKRQGDFDLAGQLACGPLPAGTYQLRLAMHDAAGALERRNYEIAVVGPIQQRLAEGASYTDGMELKEVWSVDCALEPTPGEFITWRYENKPVQTVVRESPLGRYRTLTENVSYAAFGYKFKVRNLFVPHLVEIEWPDDAARRFLAQVYEPTTMIPDEYPFVHGHAIAGYQRADTGFFATREHPVLSNQMRKEYMIYWPNEEQGCVFLYNADGRGAEAPAAAARIKVSEILNDLPALQVRDAGDHLIGYHTERGPQSMSAAYHAAPLGAMFTMRLAGIDYPEFYRDWYVTAQNMIKRMRFAGQNMYLMGHFMYNGVLYPSKHYIFSPNEYGGADAMRDHAGLILRMFARNDLKLISNIEYTSTREFHKPPTEDAIRAGAPNYLSVSRFGKVQAKGWLVWVNFYHPEVQASLLTIADELIALYKEYPAWNGISLLLSRWFGGPLQFCWYGAKDDPLDWGYEDYTVELFQRETGITVPVDARDPDRFAKRYDWLMANAQEQWINWRCAQYTALYKKIRDRLVQARPDLKLYLLCFEPTFSYSYRPTKQALDLDGKYDQPDAVQQVLKRFGFDLHALRAEPGLVVSYSYATSGSGLTYADPRWDYEAVAHADGWQSLFANDAKGGAYINSGMFHAGYDFPEGAWLFQNSVRRQGYPMGRFVNDTFVNVMVRSHPTWMPHTWMDVVDSGGRLHEMRQFARAYRSLPNGHYQRLTGNGLDKNIWIAATPHADGEFAYAANTHWWTLEEVELAFADGVEVHDLIRDRPAPLEHGRWRFQLGPYEVQTFRMRGGDTNRPGIRGASVRMPENAFRTGTAAVQAGLNDARQVARRAHARAAEFKDWPDWENVAKIDAILAEAEARSADGNMSEAWSLTMSGLLKQLGAKVVNQMLEAMPLAVIGPFGQTTDTAVAEAALGNAEVTDAFNGMETPYLGEFTGTNFTQLTQEFRPDPARTYAVHGNPAGRWQRLRKTDYLAFQGVCGSPQPFWMSAYAYTEVFSPHPRPALVLGGSDHALWVWINDHLVLKHGGHGTPRGGQRPAQPDQNRGEFTLQPGWNRILVKAVQRGETRVYLRLTDRAGQGLDDIMFRTPADG